ncbi:MAG: pilus assembly protein [Verrucomicrobia bacterium]|nr:pilus assembly protein [Verrucomicrobiota bacterium]MBU1736455.1 pilus assembly protein [Verrucomicrobiota bacterium]MBU1857222.1 pilus assembly protein [Verrucomicrobiota bacterium]
MQQPDDRRRTTDDRCRTTRDAGFFQSEIENRKSKMYSRGQAMVEFMVGLVVVLVLLAGLIQIGQLTHAHTRTMIAARAQAGQLAMASTRPVSETASLISDWVLGVDLRRHTHDDMAMVTSNAVTLPGELVGQAHLEQVPNAPVSALSTLRDSPNPAGDFFLVKGEASESVNILPIIRRLVYAHSTLEVESDAWLVWTKGIY